MSKVKLKFLILLVIPLLLSGCQSPDEYMIRDQIVKKQGFVIEFVSWLFSDVLRYILFTPFEFFKSATAISVLLKVGALSGGIVTILTMFEGIKRSISMQYTPMSQILVRYPIALVVSAMAPFIFYYAGMFTNELVKLMGLITNGSLDGYDHYSSVLQGMGERVMETIVIFVFIIVLIYYMFRVLLYHANRWFGLLFNMVTTPLAMTAYMFKPHEGITRGWVQDTIGKFMVVVVHSFFLGLIGIILYAPTTQLVTDTMGTFSYAIVKLLFSIGGLQMMLNPPKWIRGGFDSGDSFNTTRSAFKPIKQILTRMNITVPKRRS